LEPGFTFPIWTFTLGGSVVEETITKTPLGSYASAAYLTHAAKVSGSKLTCTDCKFIDNEVSVIGAILTLAGGSMARGLRVHTQQHQATWAKVPSYYSQLAHR
jgi:hypothetical protein